MKKEKAVAPESDNSWKACCYPLGSLVAQETGNRDQVAFMHILKTVFEQNRPHQLCFGVRLDQASQKPLLPELTINDNVFTLHPVALELIQENTLTVWQAHNPESISLPEWIKWHISEQRPILLLKKPAIDINDYNVSLTLIPENTVPIFQHSVPDKPVIQRKHRQKPEKKPVPPIERKIPDAIHTLVSLPWEQQQIILRALPITHKFALVERFNLLNRDNTGVHEVNYKTVLTTYPEFRNTQLKMLVYDGMKGLNTLLKGETLTPSKFNQLYELGNDIRADELTENQFYRLCGQAGVEEPDALLYAWRAQIGSDNPYPKDATSAAEQFPHIAHDRIAVYYRNFKVVEQLQEFIGARGITMETI